MPLARLNAYDSRHNVLRRFTLHGIRFEAGGPPQRVPAEVARYLERVRQIDGDPHSPLAFEITEEGAIETKEPARPVDDRQLSLVGPAAPAGTVTTSDIPKPAAPVAGPPSTDDKDTRRSGGGKRDRE